MSFYYKSIIKFIIIKDKHPRNEDLDKQVKLELFLVKTSCVSFYI